MQEPLPEPPANQAAAFVELLSYVYVKFLQIVALL